MCRGVSPTSEMRIEIGIKSGHSFWAKNRQMNEAIDFQGIFNEYWGSTKREFTIPSQSSSQPAHFVLMTREFLLGIKQAVGFRDS